MPLGLAVAVYDVIAVPPFTTGGVKATVICPTPAVTAPIGGAFGTVAGITLGELPDAGGRRTFHRGGQTCPGYPGRI